MKFVSWQISQSSCHIFERSISSTYLVRRSSSIRSRTLALLFSLCQAIRKKALGTSCSFLVLLPFSAFLLFYRSLWICLSNWTWRICLSVAKLLFYLNGDTSRSWCWSIYQLCPCTPRLAHFIALSLWLPFLAISQVSAYLFTVWLTLVHTSMFVCCIQAFTDRVPRFQLSGQDQLL